MLHLHAERLAALADDTPTPLEAAHLASCPRCADEVEAYRRLVARASASRLPVPGGPEVAAPPLTDWSTLAGRLREEGILPPAEVVPFPGSGEFRAARQPRRWPRLLLRAAAAALFTGGGVLIGRATAGDPLLPTTATSASAVVEAVRPPTSEAEALAQMARAEWQYQQAAAYLASLEEHELPPDASEMLQARLAALDEVGAVTREALTVAPLDPVINQYYLAAQGARAATLRQLDQAAPTLLVGGF